MELIQEQIDFLNLCSSFEWSLNKRGLIDVVGDFNCSNQRLNDFKGLRFGKVSGNFLCNDNYLTTLEGGPQVVGSNFFCQSNGLRTLKGGPKQVGFNYICSYNCLKTLKGSPKEIFGSFEVKYNGLTNLKGSPRKVGMNFYCSNNKLKSLEGSPRIVGGNFSSSYNELPNLKGCPLKVGGKFYSNLINIEKWNISVWMNILKDDRSSWENDVIEKFFNEKSIQKMIDEEPDTMVLELSPYREELKGLFPNLKFPDTHQEDFEMFGDLSQLGF
jgi:hypothetical protein